eukprot:746111-Hanusia_phi.AAC.3
MSARFVRSSHGAVRVGKIHALWRRVDELYLKPYVVFASTPPPSPAPSLPLHRLPPPSLPLSLSPSLPLPLFPSPSPLAFSSSPRPLFRLESPLIG